MEYYQPMKSKHTYFGWTTPQQRKLLFETWEAEHNVTQACKKAHMSRGAFYYWKPRFLQEGYAGLEEFASHATHLVQRKPEEIAQQVIALRQQHPTWGKLRIADELAKANQWERVVSPNTVRRILREAGLWSAEKPTKKGR